MYLDTVVIEQKQNQAVKMSINAEQKNVNAEQKNDLY